MAAKSLHEAGCVILEEMKIRVKVLTMLPSLGSLRTTPIKRAGGYYIVKIYSEECNRSKRYLDY